MRTAIDDMESFVALLRGVSSHTIPTGGFMPDINMQDLNTTIERFRNAINSPDANRDTSLRSNFLELFGSNILQDPAKPCGTAHNAAFPDSTPPQLLRIYYQGMSIDTTKHREMRTYGFAPPFELPLKITYRPTG